MSKLFIKDRFATTPNTLLANPNITLRAKGLFAFIQGKPDKWSFSAERISLENKEGIQSVRTALKELEEFGFLQRIKTKNDKGYWEIDYVLYSEPQNPVDEKPTLGNRTSETHITENPTSGNPTLGNHTNNIKKDIRKKDNNKKEEYICDISEFEVLEYEEIKKEKSSAKKEKNIEIEIYPTFEDFWNLYDKKTGRKKCESKWNKLSQKTKEEIMAYIPKYKLSTPDIKYRKNPETFLNSESWNDELILKQNNYGNKQFNSNSEYASIIQALRDNGLR